MKVQYMLFTVYNHVDQCTLVGWMISYLAYCIVGNFREKTFTNFTVLWLFAKVFSAKFGAWCPLAWDKRAIHESFFRFFTNLRSFSLKSFPLYGM